MAMELTAKDVEELPDGVSLKQVGNKKLILFKEGGQLLKACENKCAHMGGEFVVDVEDVAKHFVKCSMHGWKMDASTMTYPDQLKHFTTCCKKANSETPQPQLTIEETGGGAVKLTAGGPGGVVAKPSAQPTEEVRPCCAGLAPCAVEVKPGGGPEFLGGKYAWCTCGHSKNQPFCDGSHAKVPGASGPLVFEVTEEKTVYLCTCKATKNPPYCDGSHTKLTEENVGKPLPKDGPPPVADIEDLAGRPNCAQLGPCAVEVKPGGGPEFLGGKYAWCTCGHSKNQPFCDGSHAKVPGASGPLVFEVTEEKTVYLCGCKATKNPPYCDGSHTKLTEENVGKPLPK